MLERRRLAEEQFERCRRLADQHLQPVDRLQPARLGLRQQRRDQRGVDDVVHDRLLRKRRQVEVERRLPLHAERAGVDEQRGGRQRRGERQRAPLEPEPRQQRRPLQRRAVEDGDLAHPDPRQGEQDRARRTPRADDDDGLASKVQVMQRGIEAGSIGVGAQQHAVGLAHDGVHRADALAHAARIGDQIEHRHLVRQRDVAAAPVRIVAAPFDEGRKLLRRDMGGAIIGGDAELLEPECVDGRRFGMGDRIADHLGVGGHGHPRAPAEAGAQLGNDCKRSLRVVT